MDIGHGRCWRGSGSETAIAMRTGSSDGSCLCRRKPMICSRFANCRTGRAHSGQLLRWAASARVNRSRQVAQPALNMEDHEIGVDGHQFVPDRSRPHSGQTRFITGASSAAPGSK